LSVAEWLAVAGVLTCLFVGLPLIRAFACRFHAAPEVARKMIHVVMGLSCATFPWVFERPLPVWILALIATFPLVLIRVLPKLRNGVGSALHGIARPSFGEGFKTVEGSIIFWFTAFFFVCP
jgi:phytol kinase